MRGCRPMSACVRVFVSVCVQGREKMMNDILLSGGSNIVQFNHKHGLQSSSCHCLVASLKGDLK